MTTALELTGVGKRFTKYEDTPTLLGSALRIRPTTRREKLWAVRGVDVAIPEGEAFGVIGRNGSGKTTLMSLMAGVTAPSEGAVRVWGRVAPLISVGVGFHRELTGRENIYVNGMILGMSRRQVDQRVEAIIDFAEIGPFIDTPVKFYSSGMYVRLGFSVAVHSEPDILVVDEVLAVGDFAFQLKCASRIDEIRAQGTTAVLVSHNLGAVRHMCDRVMLLDGGCVRYLGDPAEAIAQFHDLLTGEPVDPSQGRPGERPMDTGVLEILSSDIAVDGVPGLHVESGQETELRVRVLPLVDADDLVFGFSIASQGGVTVYADSMALTGMGSLRCGEERVLTARFPANLPTGSYAAIASVIRNDYETPVTVGRPVHFFVTGRHTVSGLADLGATFSSEPDPGPGSLSAVAEGTSSH